MVDGCVLFREQPLIKSSSTKWTRRNVIEATGDGRRYANDPDESDEKLKSRKVKMKFEKKSLTQFLDQTISQAAGGEDQNVALMKSLLTEGPRADEYKYIRHCFGNNVLYRDVVD